jgi:hypothetical protein
MAVRSFARVTCPSDSMGMSYKIDQERRVVARSDVAYGMARMFAAFSERAGQEVRIFREMVPAEVWLEL